MNNELEIIRNEAAVIDFSRYWLGGTMKPEKIRSGGDVLDLYPGGVRSNLGRDTDYTDRGP
jgi:hypothetical protein